MVDSILLNQALHGYEDGHQLLASSLELAPDDQAILLVMSDLSGPAFRDGFESYLTGYPLRTSGYYCFARTWFAPERPRPGCVWTHTLIIRHADLARIQSFFSLDALFRRPGDQDRFDEYRDPLKFAEKPRDRSFIAQDARALFEGLYGSDRKIVIPGENSRDYESLLLAIVEQQWPRLRRGFRFCTGALSLRETDFDVSVSPPEVTHSVGSSGLVLNEHPYSVRRADEWVELANRDLIENQQNTQFRRFLWNFGPDFPDGRAAFKALAEVFSVLNSPNLDSHSDRTLSAIAHYFSSPKDARRLKMEVFGRKGRFLSEIGGDEAVVRTAVTHPEASALDPEVTAVAERAAELARKDFSAATEIALRAVELGGENAAPFIDGYLGRGEWSPRAIENIPNALVLDAVTRYPIALTRPALWKRLNSVTVSKVLRSIDLRGDLMHAAISAAIASKRWELLGIVIEQVGTEALLAVFDVVDHSASEQLDYPSQFYSVISTARRAVMELMEGNRIGPASLKLLTAELDPRSWPLRRVGLDPWLEAAKANVRFTDRERSIRSAVFLLAMGLSSRENVAATLIAVSFGEVYEAAKQNILHGAVWDELEPTLVWFSPDWDKCVRLVRTVALAFKERGWPMHCFGETFQTREQIAQALAELNENRDGRKFIRRLKDATLHGDLEWTAEQGQVVRGFF